MRTTLDIDDDVLQAAKELAAREKSTAGRVISDLARRELAGAARSGRSERSEIKNAVPVFSRRGDLITSEHVTKLMDQEGV